MPLAIALAGCLPTPVFECDEHDDCRGLGDEAQCDPIGYCSVLDPSCTSGRRFHEFAGAGLADACTDAACGDGIPSEGEQCDDGNDVDGDGCNRDCRLSGQEIWTQTYASPGNVEDRAYAIAIDSRGSAAIIGHTSEAGEGFNLWVRKYTTDGEPEWTWVIGGDANADEEGWSIVVDENDDFVIGGYITTLATGNDGFVAKLTSDGFKLWEARVDGGQARIDQVRGVLLADDGDVVAVGYSTIDLQHETEIWYQRRSPDGQQVRWTKTRPGVADNQQDRGHAVTKLLDDFVGVGFRQDADVRARPWITRFDAAGNDVWTDEGALPDAGDGGWTTVTTLPNGELLLVGWIDAPAGDADIWLQRRSPDGAVLWEEIVASPGGAEDRGNAATAAPDGGYVVGGELGAGAGSTDAWLRRYAADGTPRWEDTISGPAGDRDTVWGLAFDPAGDLWACGYISMPATGWDIWVRKYTP